MGEVNLLEAFGRYNAKPVSRGRSAMSRDGSLVLSCWYARFHKAEGGVLRYEEDLSGEKGDNFDRLRAHLAEALAQERDIRLIVAVPAAAPANAQAAEADTESKTRTKATTFHARVDLLGRVTFYDGQRFIIEFRREAMQPARESAGAKQQVH